MNPKRKRKHRNAYFSFSTSLSFSDTRFSFIANSHNSLENIPTQVSWGHATCNTRLGQRRCYSFNDLQSTEIEIEIVEGQEKRLLGYANATQNFIRSKNGDVWIRIAKGNE